MAAPETPLCYVGVARQSAAFRLMKQMVSIIISLPRYCLFVIIIIIDCALNSITVCDSFRDGKKEKALAKRSRGSRDMFESVTSRTLLVCFFFALSLPSFLYQHSVY